MKRGLLVTLALSALSIDALALLQLAHDSRAYTTGVFHGCSPAGNGGDPYLNQLKNRDKPGPARSFAQIARVVASHPPHAQAMNRRARAHWTAQALSEVVPGEQRFVTVEGYMLQARDEGQESCNCSGLIGIDTHTWLAPTPTANRGTQSLVAEVSPRMKGVHPHWNQQGFHPLIQGHVKLRVTGWTMWDQEHLNEVGHSRGTVWEIHPIHDIQYLDAQGAWKKFG